MSNRRHFLQTMGGLSAGMFALPWADPQLIRRIETAIDRTAHLPAEVVAQDESFWYPIQRAYRQSPHFLNLENGYFSPQPVEVMEAQLENIRMINEVPSFYMRRRQFEEKDGVKRQLAEFAGCSAEEIVITRNTTESLDTIIAGIDFQPGDEAVMTNQDYGSMLEAFEQQARRRGLVNRIIDLPLHPKSDDEVVQAYEKAITPRTKIMLVTQLINITGQILPTQKICDMAHRHGVEVIVDGAHAFAMLDFKIPDLHCDYFGASLHKWLCCPLGAGILYVKKDKISKVWPLFGDTGYPATDIRKFEHIGTHPVHTNLTIASALRFHQLIGSKRKQERLQYLKQYWTDKVKDLPKVVINTPLEANRSCAIANIGIKGMSAEELAKYLYDQHRIFTVAINHKSFNGVRVTPHLYTTLEDLDRFVEVIRNIGA